MTDRELVVGVDSSTQSTKAIVWDRSGRAVAVGTAALEMSSPAPGWYEQEATAWWASLRSALATIWGTVDPARVVALAIANQRETMVCLDAAREPLRPAMLWLDERPRDELPLLDAALGGDRIHRITGKPLDLTPAIGRIAWLRDHEPTTYSRTATFCDVHAYLCMRLTGELATSWASADPFGVFDMTALRWSAVVLDELRLGEDRFPRAIAPGSALGTITEAAATATGLRHGTPIIAGGGDGQCAGLGVNCVSPGRAYINLGTALVSGVWSATYEYAREWRTLTSASGEGYILETLQRSGAFLINWFTATFGAGRAPAELFADLESGAAAVSIGSDGLLALPYFSGCSNPYWDPDARGCFIGLSPSHTTYHLYRSIVEGLTLESARAAAAIRAIGIPIDEFVAIGGGANSRFWVQMVADATDRPVRVCETVEATALGAGILAAFGAGWFPTVREAASAMCGRTATVDPVSMRVSRYRELMTIHGEIYRANAATFAAIKRFKAGAMAQAGMLP